MVPAWHKSDRIWEPCWLISTSPHGAGQQHVLIAFDDRPHPTWAYPPGSLRIDSVPKDRVRIRREVIPLLENPDGD